MIKELHQYDSGMASVNTAKFDKSGTTCMVGSEDGIVRLFNTVSHEKEGELRGHEDAVLDICMDPISKEGYVITASADHTFRVWQ